MADINLNDLTSVVGKNLIEDVDAGDVVLVNAVDSGLLLKVTLIQALAVTGGGNNTLTVTLTDDSSSTENVIIPDGANVLNSTVRFVEAGEPLYITEGYTLTVSDDTSSGETNVLISYEEIS